MIDWLVATLRSDPELLIILFVDMGFRRQRGRGFQTGERSRNASGRDRHRQARHHRVGQCQVYIPHVVPFAIGYRMGWLKILFGLRRETRSKKM